MSETIPEDVREAAKKAIDTAWDEHAELFGASANFISRGLWDRIEEAVALALLARDERAAKIVEGREFLIGGVHARSIASAIRDRSKP